MSYIASCATNWFCVAYRLFDLWVCDSWGGGFLGGGDLNKFEEITDAVLVLVRFDLVRICLGGNRRLSTNRSVIN